MINYLTLSEILSGQNPTKKIGGSDIDDESLTTEEFINKFKSVLGSEHISFSEESSGVEYYGGVETSTDSEGVEFVESSESKSSSTDLEGVELVESSESSSTDLEGTESSSSESNSSEEDIEFMELDNEEPKIEMIEKTNDVIIGSEEYSEVNKLLKKHKYLIKDINE